MFERRLAAYERQLDRMGTPRAVAFDFTRYRSDPIAFYREVLGCQSATRRSDGSPYQDEILAAVNESPRLAVVAGHGVGKTRSLAALSLWWLLTRPFSRVAIVAPQFERQVKGVIFAELGKLVRRAIVKLPLELRSGSVLVAGYGQEWSISGLPATEPDRIEGLHAEGGLLLLMDETKGIPQTVFDALQGALTGGDDSRLVIASTPGGCAGPFWRACTDDRGLYRVIRLNSEDSSLVSPTWCQDRGREWGKDSVLYQTRVCGEFADAGEGQLFPLSVIESAIDRPPTETNSRGTVLGVDVARSVSGDCSAVAIVRDGTVERATVWRTTDTMTTVQRVVHETLSAKPRSVLVDETGVGAGVLDRLKQVRLPGCTVSGVVFGGAASDPRRFKNRRAELYWSFREALEQGAISLPDDDELVADLSSIRFTFDQAGRVLLESKDDTRRRLGRSPDRADAVVMAVSGFLDQASTVPVCKPFSLPLYADAWLGGDDDPF